MYNVLVALPVLDYHKELLEKSGKDCQFRYTEPDNVTCDMVHEADIVIGNVPVDFVQSSTRLKWLQLNSAGADKYTSAMPKGAILTNATGAYGLAISEHLLAALLSIKRNSKPYKTIAECNTLVVGFGNIGSEFAKRIHKLGGKVWGIRRNKAEKPDYLEDLYTSDSLLSVLPDMDVVVSCLPGTKETQNLFDEQAFSAMKKGSYFLNIGRGSSVDSAALGNALNTGHLAGASVDVTDIEPLPMDHPLWDAKNLLLTPHISGFYHLYETFELIISISASNLEKFTSDQELDNIVDPDTGYRTFRA